MWTTTYHRFLNRATFLEACQAAGWICPPGREPELPQGVVIDIVGPIIGRPVIDEYGALVAGEVLDPRYHVNIAWHGRQTEPAFQASLVVPATPSRGWDVSKPSMPPAPVPLLVPAWKGKAALREVGLLDAVEAAVAAAGGRILDAWSGASEWSRDSDFLQSLAAGLGLTSTEIDEIFRNAYEIMG